MVSFACWCTGVFVRHRNMQMSLMSVLIYSLRIVVSSLLVTRSRCVSLDVGVVSCCRRIINSLTCYLEVAASEAIPHLRSVVITTSLRVSLQSRSSHIFSFFLYIYFLCIFLGVFFVRVNRKSEFWCFAGGFFRLFLLDERVEEKKGRYEFIGLCEEFLLLLRKNHVTSNKNKKQKKSKTRQFYVWLFSTLSAMLHWTSVFGKCILYTFIVFCQYPWIKGFVSHQSFCRCLVICIPSYLGFFSSRKVMILMGFWVRMPVTC